MGGIGSIWLVAWAIWFRRPEGAPAEAEAQAGIAAMPSGGLRRLVCNVSMWGLSFSRKGRAFTRITCF
jgi:hypothetical protein